MDVDIVGSYPKKETNTSMLGQLSCNECVSPQSSNKSTHQILRFLRSELV